MAGNVRLLVVGLVLGFLSALYPRLPSLLPHGISSRLPFVGSNVLDPDLSRTWRSVQRYQDSVPILGDHDVESAESKWEQEIERQLRFGSKEGGREIEKELKRVRREIEKRAQEAGKENLIKLHLPVYYLDHASSLERDVSLVGSEINSLVPLSVLVVYSNPESSNRHLLVSSSTTGTHHSPSPKLVQSLQTAFLKAAASAAPAASPPPSLLSSSLVTPPPRVSDVLESLKLDREIKLTLLEIPTDREWTRRGLAEVGKTLHEFRHHHHDHHHVKNPKRSHHDDDDDEQDDGVRNGPFSFSKAQDKKHKAENDLLELSKRTVIISIGHFPMLSSDTFSESLHDILEHSTLEARAMSLSALYSSTRGHKPTKDDYRPGAKSGQDEGIVGLLVAVEAAGEGEGERVVPGNEGLWRFGGLPIR